jgi:hypothetical protein
MRCQYKACGGLILKQEAFGPYPERFYCHLCGREPKLKDPMTKKSQNLLIEEPHDSNHPKGDQDMLGEPQTKICQKCKVEKPIDDFGIRRSADDGHNPVCLECRRKYYQEFRTKQAKKTKVPGLKPKTDKSKASEPPQKKTIAQPEEMAETQFIKAFKKDTIKTFIRNNLIPILERALEEEFK